MHAKILNIALLTGSLMIFLGVSQSQFTYAETDAPFRQFSNNTFPRLDQKLGSVDETERDKIKTDLLARRTDIINILRGIVRDSDADWDVRIDSASLLGEMRATEAAEDVLLASLAYARRPGSHKDANAPKFNSTLRNFGRDVVPPAIEVIRANDDQFDMRGAVIALMYGNPTGSKTRTSTLFILDVYIEHETDHDAKKRLVRARDLVENVFQD